MGTGHRNGDWISPNSNPAVIMSEVTLAYHFIACHRDSSISNGTPAVCA